MSFTHLHSHTHYSLLDGAAKIRQMVNKAATLGMDSLAITDHGNLFGAIEFYKSCYEYGVKPIIGAECYVAPNSRFEKNFRSSEDSHYHIVLLAKDYQGYKNLIKLVSLGYLEGFYYKPRVDKELLAQYNQGLICLSSCLKGEISRSLLQDNFSQALKKTDDCLTRIWECNTINLTSRKT